MVAGSLKLKSKKWFRWWWEFGWIRTYIWAIVTAEPRNSSVQNMDWAALSVMSLHSMLGSLLFTNMYSPFKSPALDVQVRIFCMPFEGHFEISRAGMKTSLKYTIFDWNLMQFMCNLLMEFLASISDDTYCSDPTRIIEFRTFYERFFFFRLNHKMSNDVE